MARLTRFATSLALLALICCNTVHAIPTTVDNPGFGYTRIGCYNDPMNPRALADEELDSSQQSVTVEVCAQFCQSYTYMGVEAGSECYCGNSVANTSSEVTTESGLNCDTPAYACVGNANEQCGGDGTLDIYAKAGATVAAAGGPQATGFVYVQDSSIVGSVVGASGTYNYIGCLVDPGVGTKPLNGANSAYGAQSVDDCADFCVGYTYMGLESGGECYCGGTIDNGATLATCQAECDNSCAADPTQRCGGYFRLTTYELNGANFTDPNPTAVCSYNGPATAIQTGSTSYTYYGPVTTGSTMIDITTTNSNGQTTSYTSTEYYCEGDCDAARPAFGGAVTATASPTATPTDVGGCSYIGCYDDNGGPRTLTYPQTQLNESAITQELCVSTCLGQGYPFAGVEYGSQCYCGESIVPPHTVVEPGNITSSGIFFSCTDPQYACTGDNTEQCGGFTTVDIWHCQQNDPRSSMSFSIITPQPQPSTSAPVGSGTTLASSSVLAVSTTTASLSDPAITPQPSIPQPSIGAPFRNGTTLPSSSMLAGSMSSGFRVTGR